MSRISIQLSIDDEVRDPDELMDLWHRIPYIVNSINIKHIKNMVKTIPNDQELGEAIRTYFKSQNQ